MHSRNKSYSQIGRTAFNASSVVPIMLAHVTLGIARTITLPETLFVAFWLL